MIGGQARNVILLIGDGMGDSEITIARNYAVGAAGRLAMDTLPMTGAYTTYSVDEGRPEPAGLRAGLGGDRHRLGDRPQVVRRRDLGDPRRASRSRRSSSWPRRPGYRTGDVTTAELTDATPAVLAAHVVDRGCKGPHNMANCPTNDKVRTAAPARSPSR